MSFFVVVTFHITWLPPKWREDLRSFKGLNPLLIFSWAVVLQYRVAAFPNGVLIYVAPLWQSTSLSVEHQQKT